MSIKKANLFVFIILSLIITACSDPQKDGTESMNSTLSEDLTEDNTGSNFNEYSAREAYELLKKNKKNNDLVLLDVRSNSEHSSGHIEGSIHVNFISPDFKNELTKLDKDKKYIVYCLSGGRSEIAVKIMKDLNFKEAHNIEGGLSEWKSQDLPMDISE